MELQELNDRYLDIIDSILLRYDMEGLRKELTFGMVEAENGNRHDAVFVQLGQADEKKGTLTSLDERSFSIDVESLILDIRAARQEVPKGS